MAFRFRLQRVLDVAVQAERLAEGELAAAVARREEARMRLSALEDRRREQREAFGRRLRAGLRAWEWAAHAAYLARLGEALEAAARELGEREAEVEACRAALVERMRERRALETLRDKAVSRHRQEEAVAARRALDEVNVARWRRVAATPLS